MSIQCDVTIHFTQGQPSKTIHIWRAKDEHNARTLAILDCQAKGWDVREPLEVIITGVLPS